MNGILLVNQRVAHYMMVAVPSYDKTRKEMFYLRTFSTHFIYSIEYMVKDHLDNESGYNQ